MRVHFQPGQILHVGLVVFRVYQSLWGRGNGAGCSSLLAATSAPPLQTNDKDDKVYMAASSKASSEVMQPTSMRLHTLPRVLTLRLRVPVGEVPGEAMGVASGLGVLLPL